MKTLHNPVKGAIPLKFPVGSIYQLYGENKELYLKAIGSNGHNGLDFAMSEGTPILATNGEVVEVKDTPEGYGKHIRILTDPDEEGVFYELVFGHLKDIMVKIGDWVDNGRVIATMGNTGFVISGSTPYWNNAPAGKGVHLHFGVRECSANDMGWATTYSSGKTVFVKNYENGLFGYIDPQQFIEVDNEFVLRVRVSLLTRMLNMLKILVGLKNNKGRGGEN